MQVRRVLGAISLNTPAPRAALAAAEVAALAGADLTVLTVLRDPWELVRADEVEGLRRTHLGSPAAVATQRAVARLKEVAAPAVLSAPRVSYQAAFGWPSVEIARRAEEIAADLIVIGRGVDVVQSKEESVTAATLRRSRVPVLVAPLHHRVYRRILVCVDESPHAFPVLDAALAMSQYADAHLVALHVEPSDHGEPMPGERRPWQRHLAQAFGGCGTAVAEYETIVCHGDAATAILARATADDADLIVFGYRHGLHYGDAAAIGTVAVRLLRRAECALLAVPM
jgi:nucleotide-binding universal stress UspA family protein